MLNKTLLNALKNRSGFILIPLLVGILLCFLTGILWWVLDQHEKTGLRNKIKTKAQSLANHVDTDMENRILILQRMAKRWEVRGSMPHKEFAADTYAHVSDTPGFRAFGWVDRNYRLQWVVPISGNEKVQGLNLAFEEKRRLAMEKARNTRSPASTSIIELAQGGKGFLIFYPLYSGDDFNGFLMTAFRAGEWLGHVFKVNKDYAEYSDFRIRAVFEDYPVFQQSGWDTLRHTELEAISEPRIMTCRTYIQVRPTEAFISRNSTILPEMVAGLGLLFSILIGFVIHLLQKTRADAWSAYEAKSALETEILQRKEAEYELQSTLMRLNLATKAGGIGIWTLDVSTSILLWNERMYELYDLPQDVIPSYETWCKAVHPDDLALCATLLENALKGKAAFDTEFRILLQNGSIRHIKAAARLERDRAGGPKRLIGIDWDITELKLAEENLRESERRFRSLVEATSDWVWEIDRKGTYTYVSPKVEDLLGYTPSEVIGKTAFDLMLPEEAERVETVMSAFMKNQMPITAMENINIHKYGRQVILETSAVPVYDKNGDYVGYRGIDREITARKLTDEMLKKSEEQVRLLLNSTAEAIYGIDLEGNCIFANSACARMLGYSSPDDLLEKNVHALIHHSRPDGTPIPEQDCRISAAFKEGTGVHVDDEVLWKADGTCFPVEYWSYPQIANGEVTGAVVTFLDITQRKKADEALAIEKRRLSNILEGTNVGTWEWNVQTGETIFNERWAGMIGYTLDELAPVTIDTWANLSHPDDIQIAQELLKKNFRKELGFYECEIRMRHKDGHWIWVLDRGKVTVWTEGGKPLIMSGTHQDITERKLNEEIIRHMATHDALTDLPTLRLAEERLSMAIGISRRRKSMTAVMFIDLDGFKDVNDTLGHDTGDEVLKHVARRLLSCSRETDTVARVGGDEFLVIAMDIRSREDASMIAEKIIHQVSEPLNVDGRRVSVGASIGIALYPENGSNTGYLIKQADQAMYSIKVAGKNGFGFAEGEGEGKPRLRKVKS